MTSDFGLQVLEAAGRADVCDAVELLYAAVQAETDARRPVCVASGKCCRFEEYGHRLYVTTVEMGTFVRRLGEVREVLTGGAKPPGDGLRRVALAVVGGEPGCRFQVEKMCSVHAFRPFGCRMFFCDATSTEWQNDRYERFHADLKRLHQSLSVPYHYVEWRQALRECLGAALEIL